jgi:hypothetical protein
MGRVHCNIGIWITRLREAQIVIATHSSAVVVKSSWMIHRGSVEWRTAGRQECSEGQRVRTRLSPGPN